MVARVVVPVGAVAVIWAVVLTMVVVAGAPGETRELAAWRPRPRTRDRADDRAFAFAGWRRPRGDRFTVHRTNGWGLYAGTFVALTLVETPLVHVTLAAFGHATAAWVLTGLSLYSVVWLVGDLHALRHGGIAVRGDVVELTIGVRWRARIARRDIVWAARCDGATCKASDFSILGANVVLRLAGPREVRGLFGRRRVVRELALSVDDTDRFLAALRGDSLAVAHHGT